MAEVVDENNFTVTVNKNTYKVSVSYEDVYLSHYRIETDCQYLFTLYSLLSTPYFLPGLNRLQIILQRSIDN